MENEHVFRVGIYICVYVLYTKPILNISTF